MPKREKATPNQAGDLDEVDDLARRVRAEHRAVSLSVKSALVGGERVRFARSHRDRGNRQGEAGW